jgi:hypothetical protein
MVMVKCPQTARAIPTGITIDRESFQRSPVFFRRTRCPICNTEHAWFAQEAWVDEPSAPGTAHQSGHPNSSSKIAMEEPHFAAASL